MKSGLRNIILSGAMALGLAGGLKGQQMVVNPFLQPNDSTKTAVWDTLKTTSERNNYLNNKLYNEDKTDTIKKIPDKWVCTDFARQLATNFNGYGELGFDKEKGLEDNGEYNVPMYTVTLMKPFVFHQIDAVNVGSKVSKINDWRFIEPDNDSTYNLNTFNDWGVYKIVVNHTFVKENEIQGKFLSSIPMLEFVPDGNGGWKDSGWRNSGIKLIEEDDPLPPNISKTSPLENETYDDNPKLNYNIRDANFKSARYSIDNGKTWNSLNQSGTKTLNLANGDYKLIIEADDYFKLKSRDSVNFKVDKKTGLEDKVSDSKIKVYPYPAKDNLTFEYENKEGRETYLEMYNSAGQLIGREKSNDEKINMDVSDYSHGLYIYRLLDGKTNKTISSGKVVRE